MAKRERSVEKMLAEIREAMARCPAPEQEVYEALVDEAAGWQMRLDELTTQENEGE